MQTGAQRADTLHRGHRAALRGVERREAGVHGAVAARGAEGDASARA
jgi:hypothetical protein